MTEIRRLMVAVPAVLLAGLLVVLFLTRGRMEQLSFLRKNGSGEVGLVDQRPFQTAQTLAELAVSAEEQGFAQEAKRLADHEVDQAFAMALRLASVQGRVLTGKAAALAGRVEMLKQMVTDDKTRVDALEKTAKDSPVAPMPGDDLDVARAQLQLDTDELTDAVDDLARESGDQRGAIQQELTAREAVMKKFDAEAGGKPLEGAVTGSRRYGTLSGRASAWFAERNRAQLIAQARERAEADARDLATQHAALEGKNKAAESATGLASAAGGARVKLLQTLATQRVIMGILDDRVQAQQQLAVVYARWEKQVWVQHRIVARLLLASFAWIAFIILIAELVRTFGILLLHKVATDTRRVATLETILTVAVEILGVIAILLVVFGAPAQTPTILGFATAGLTVVFQDFILAFFGWFVLMGKNGIRVSDWVEINSVGGEVSEIGLFRTTLLETGNWTSRGHPTGRRVRFINSFAIRGQYFNFSTHGQWMWDEIKLNVSATANAYELMKRMQGIVEKLTAQDTEQAEGEWQRVTRQNGLSQFSAKPTVDLRPAASGVDMLVRFVTKAGDRFEVRNKLYEALLLLMDGVDGASLRPGESDPS